MDDVSGISRTDGESVAQPLDSIFSPSKNTHEAECVTADVVWWEVPKAESLCPLHLLTVLWNSAQLQEGLLGENLVWLQNSNKRNLLRH